MGIPWIIPHKRMVWGKRGWWKSGQHELLIVLGYSLFGLWLWNLSANFRF
jgi:hypothetical protein